MVQGTLSPNLTLTLTLAPSPTLSPQPHPILTLTTPHPVIVSKVYAEEGDYVAAAGEAAGKLYGYGHGNVLFS